MAKQQTKFNMGLVIVFIGLSIFDLLANAGAIVMPFIGSVTETVQELLNEIIQITILIYFFAIVKK